MGKLSFIFLIFFSCQKQHTEDLKFVSNSTNNFSQQYLDSLDRAHTNQIKFADTRAFNAEISKTDSILWTGQSNNPNYVIRIFGYEQPSLKSKRVFLISCFTNDVDKNPFDLKYGAFYSTVFMDSIRLKFISKGTEFSKIQVIRPKLKPEYIFILNEWLEGEQIYE
jgi:hypothetical protein